MVPLEPSNHSSPVPKPGPTAVAGEKIRNQPDLGSHEDNLVGHTARRPREAKRASLSLESPHCTNRSRRYTLDEIYRFTLVTNSSKHVILSAIYISAAFLPVACTPSHSNLESGLRADDPADRIGAIWIIAERQAGEFLPQLVDRLEDPDAAVRFYAILALDKMTGTRLDYSYADPASRRRAAINGWRDYLVERQAEAAVPVAEAEAQSDTDARGGGDQADKP